MYKFIKTKDEDNPYDRCNIEMSCEAETIEDLLEDFTNFLKASGFGMKLNDRVELVKEEEYISVKTLKMMDDSIDNFKNEIVGEPIDLPPSEWDKIGPFYYAPLD